MSAETSRKRCFVVMGFGKKTDFETGRTLDLDKSYRNIIKPAVEAAGLECMRADEIVHSGLIDVPMYEQLLTADIVIADLSTSNRNALYELGLCHALRPFGTIIISEDGMRVLPFDVNRVVVRQYHHLGEDIGYDEIMRFRQLLTEAVKETLANLEKAGSIPDSPLYMFLEGLQPPSIGIASAKAPPKGTGTGTRSGTGSGGTGSGTGTGTGTGTGSGGTGTGSGHDRSKNSAVTPTTNDTLAILREQAEQAIRETRFTDAIASLERALQLNPNDPTLLQQHVLATYKAGQPDRVTALFSARDLLASLSPAESTDRETLELLGDIELALFDAQQGVNHLLSARRSYERLHRIKGDWRSGIVLANLIVQQNEYKKDPIDRLADIAFADQLRRDVVQFGKERLAVINELRRMEEFLPKNLKTEDRSLEQSKVWCAIAEAYYGLGDNEGYLEARDQAARSKNGAELLKTLDKKIGQLAHLLESQAKFRSLAEGLFDSRISGNLQTGLATKTLADLVETRDSNAARTKAGNGSVDRCGGVLTSRSSIFISHGRGPGGLHLIRLGWREPGHR